MRRKHIGEWLSTEPNSSGTPERKRLRSFSLSQLPLSHHGVHPKQGAGDAPTPWLSHTHSRAAVWSNSSRPTPCTQEKDLLRKQKLGILAAMRSTL